MTRQEIMATRYGEMLDMIACLEIVNGAEPLHRPSIITDMQKALEVR